MSKVIIRQPGLQEYQDIHDAMVAFTNQRSPQTVDEIWCLEHEPVFTLGLAGKAEHLLDPGAITVHRTDRGGQVTYHGPGQLVVYPLIDLKRLGVSIKGYVNMLEQAVIDCLAGFGLDAQRRAGMPGVYLDGSKIAALGVRVRKGCCYHGLALNVSMDLSPFRRINPCGYPGLEVTQLADRGVGLTVGETLEKFLPCLLEQFSYNEVEMFDE
jgi:lipoyl(octanoyl) transferase